MAKQIKRSAESFTYVLLGDRDLPIDQQTTFTLRPMTMNEHAFYHDGLVRTVVDRDGTRTIVSRTRQQGVAIALEHIVEVQNFPVGAPQPWPKGREEREAYLAQMAHADVQELASVVMHRSDVGDDAKNSSRPERTSASGDDSRARTSTTAPPAASAG